MILRRRARALVCSDCRHPERYHHGNLCVRCSDGRCRAGSSRRYVEPDAIDRHPVLVQVVGWLVLLIAALFITAFIFAILLTKVL